LILRSNLRKLSHHAAKERPEEALPSPSTIKRGYSQSLDPVVAVAELHAAVWQPDAALVMFFCSVVYDMAALAAEIAARFAGVTVIGCTTAGEITPVGYLDGSLTGFSLSARDCRVRAVCLQDVGGNAPDAGFLAAEGALADLAAAGETPDSINTFGLLLIDGMCGHEEMVVSTIHWAMGDIPLLGGSAGDDLRLKNTFIYYEGAFHRNAALLALVQTSRPFRAFRSQHFTGSATKMVVTRSDPARRIVNEINAEPAAREYARIAGLTVASPETIAERPMMVKIGGEFYVRSIQQVLPCGSLVFYSAIEQGVVLTLAERQDLLGHLDGLFASISADLGPPDLVIGFDCVLRAREAERHQIRHTAGQMLADNNVIGFSTYGEQFSAMHLNQTFTGVALGRPAVAA
jgi:hypothetical protein